MTQCERLLVEFEKGRVLTMWEILHELRIGNHTGRISDLRAKGYEIDDIGTKGYGVFKMRGKKCQKEFVNVATKDICTTGQTNALSKDATANNLFQEEPQKIVGDFTPKNTRFHGYKCAKGHIDHWYGSNPPKTIKCAGCNYQMDGSLIT